MTEVLERQEVVRNVVLGEPRIKPAEVLRRDWVVNAEAGTTVEDILRPGYWAHVAAGFAIFDHIEVRIETGEWIVNLIVTESGRNFAKVFLAHKYDLTQTPKLAAPAEAHKVVWKGTHHKHCVVRLSDDATLESGFDKKDAAEAWLRNYEKGI